MHPASGASARDNHRGRRQQAMTRPFTWALVGGAIVIAAIALSFLGDTDESEQAAAPTAGAEVPAPASRTAPSPQPAPPPAPPAAEPAETAAAVPAKPGPDPVPPQPQGGTAAAERAEPGARIQAPDGGTDEGKQAPPPAVMPAPAPSAQPAPPPETARPSETAAAEPAKPRSDMVRTKPQGGAAAAKRAQPGARIQTLDGGTAKAEQAPPPAGVQAPAPPAQTAPSARAAPSSGTAAAEPARPSFDVVRINPRGDTVMAGRAEPGARVQILDGGKVIGEATADARGEWVFVPAEPLPPGNRQLSLRTVGTAGRPAMTSDSNVVLVVPEKGKDIAGRPSEEPSRPLALKVPSEGGGATQVLQKPTPPAPAAPAPAVTVDAVDYDDGGRLNVSGTGAPDGRVHLYLNNEFLGRSPTGADGRWRQSPERTVAPGVYSVRADQVDDAGKVLDRIEVIFARSTVLTDVPPGTLFVVQPGNSLWRIARRTYGRGVRFTVIFEANRKQIRDADLIYPGQVFRLPSIN